MTCFICVNYNNSDFTIKFIVSVLKFNEDIFKIIIVDNFSEENDFNSLKIFINDLNSKCITLIRSDSNLGYFKGLNLGLNSINVFEFKNVVISNNDVTFDPNFLQKLNNKSLNDNVFVIAPNIIRTDGVHQNPHVLRKFNLLQRIYRKIFFSNFLIAKFIYLFYNIFRVFFVKEDRLFNDKEQVILMGYGACYVLTNFFFKKFSQLNAPTFLMGEEGVLASQVIGANGVTLYCPDLIVNHHDHSSIGKLPSRKLYNYSRESYKYYLKNLKNIQ